MRTPLQSWAFLLAAVLAAVTLGGQNTKQNAPTNSQDAETIDQTWQNASSKYDSERSSSSLTTSDVVLCADAVP